MTDLRIRNFRGSLDNEEDEPEQELSCNGRDCGECQECDAKLEKAIHEAEVEDEIEFARRVR